MHYDSLTAPPSRENLKSNTPSLPTQPVYGVLAGGWSIVLASSVIILIYFATTKRPSQWFTVTLSVIICVGGMLVLGGSIAFGSGRLRYRVTKEPPREALCHSP